MNAVTSADDTRIAYERRGSGPPLVLVHGSASSRTVWRGSIPRFANEFTVYCFDRRGRGDSGDGDDYSLDREVEDLRAVLDAADGPAAVYGHSFGALCTFELARRTDQSSESELSGPNSSELELSGFVLYEPAILVPPHDRGAEATLADRL